MAGRYPERVVHIRGRRLGGSADFFSRIQSLSLSDWPICAVHARAWTRGPSARLDRSIKPKVDRLPLEPVVIVYACQSVPLAYSKH